MYYQKIALAAAVAGIASTVLHASRRDWNQEAREPLHYTFSNDKTLDVDDFNGRVEVVGDGGNTIRVEGERVIRAASQRELERAKKDVRLDANDQNGTARLYVDGPFRHHEWSDDRDYEVDYNFAIHVPRETELRLRSLNGEIRTEQTGGKFDIRGINGTVTMTGAAGGGSVRTVNGKVTASFRENPKAPIDFATVNGAIEAAFPPDLSADVRLSTVNGQAYTDFEATGAPDGRTERRDGKFVFKPDRLTHVRIGSGGAELKFETVDGEIRIRKESSK